MTFCREKADAAEARFAVAAQRNVWFYSRADDAAGLFILPYTYYVRIVSEGNDFCAVEYLEDDGTRKKVSGFCKTEQLTFVDFTPARPYLYRDVVVKYQIQDAVNPSGTGPFDSVERTFAYYGTYYMGTSLYQYVYSDGNFGYVPAAEEPVYDLNTDYLSAIAEPEPEEPQQQTSLSSGIIVAICVLCVALVAIAALVLRGKRASSHEVSEESDF